MSLVPVPGNALIVVALFKIAEVGLDTILCFCQ